MRVGTYQWLPYVVEHDGKLTGIFIELFAALAEKSGLEFSVVNLPMKRMLTAFQTDLIDAECFVDPNWREEYKSLSVYSEPIMQTYNVVLMLKAKAFKATSSKDFSGMRLGCNLGYFYTDGFQEAFGTNQILRDDSNTSESLVQKLTEGRVNAIIMDQYEARFTLQSLGLDSSNYAVSYKFTTKSLLRLRLQLAHKSLLPRINEGIKAVIASGAAKRILDGYLR